MSKMNRRGFLVFKTGLTFVCFLTTLVVLFYLGMGGKVSDLTGEDGFFGLRRDVPEPLFYQSIGLETHDGDEGEIEQVAQVYTLELALATSRQDADRLISKLLRDEVRAFYSEVRKGDKTAFSVRKGIFSSLEDARSASRALLARKDLPNKVIELH